MSQQHLLSAMKPGKADSHRPGQGIHLINSASDQVKDEATALTLSQQIFEMTMELKTQPTGEAMQFLKKEMEQFF